MQRVAEATVGELDVHPVHEQGRPTEDDDRSEALIADNPPPRPDDSERDGHPAAC